MTAGHIRLVDDVFSRICQAINDVREPVRCLAAQLIGTMTGVRQGRHCMGVLSPLKNEQRKLRT
jgi:hypothetical protein